MVGCIFSIPDAQQQYQQPASINYDQIEFQLKDDGTTIAKATTVNQQQHSNASVLSSSSSSSPSSSSVPTSAASSTWQTMQPARIQSMVMQNDGTIILCDNDPDIRPSRIEVVEIVSPPNYIRGKISLSSNLCCLPKVDSVIDVLVLLVSC